MESGGLPG
ncbi:hypothetical protein BLA29_014047 [Euroglyphus maynei]|uniref:Uncharacterized protein n=1 Tax=Euroglyphus maynei TaxID=6958 RepID=A0A1Y3ATS0_EURMA|nr:hypothetical protein BLA29_014047 [Euroglyphus maynei]